jgi:HPt (histidine-containing phosphotransfer) domain-containing protein
MDQDLTRPERGDAVATRPVERAFDGAGLLERLGGDETIFVEVVKVFLEDAPGQIDAMGAAGRAGDTMTLRRLAHTLKGAAGTICATALQEAALALEQAVDRADVDAARALIAPVGDRYVEVHRAITGWLGGEERA